jgi:glutaminyl-peptide cyclotransferase
MNFYRLAIFYLFLIATPSCNNNETATEIEKQDKNAVPLINYAVTKTYPHDTTSFTEGLLIHEGQLYESTGSPEDMPQTRSVFGPIDTITGMVNKKVEIDRKYFGEGICFLNRKIYQLTYKHKRGFIYDAKKFSKLGEFDLPIVEGWGMTTDGVHLIISDGTNNITYINPAGFNITKALTVTYENKTLDKINELEYINGYIYANVYGTSTIIKIDPSNGKVISRLELSSLVTEAASRYGVQWK